MTQPDLPDVPSLRVLEPPPGGLARVRDSIDEQSQRRPWWLVVAPLVAAAAVALILLTGRPPHQLRTAQAVAPVAAPVADPTMGAGFYWVASQPVARPSRPTIDSVGSAPAVLTP